MRFFYAVVAICGVVMGGCVEREEAAPQARPDLGRDQGASGEELGVVVEDMGGEAADLAEPLDLGEERDDGGALDLGVSEEMGGERDLGGGQEMGAQEPPHEYWDDASIVVNPPAPFTLGGQQAWFHDEGDLYGFFHTYDAFAACGAQYAARKVHVFLPRPYEVSGRRYAVLYMHDGNTAFWPGGISGQAWEVARGMSSLVRARQVEPVIIVAVHPINRDREYTHQEAYPGRDCCGAQEYTDYLADCIKPFVDQHYRTIADASRTGVLGSSHGGLISFWAATRRPDAFRRAGALSPSFWVGLDPLNQQTPLSQSQLVMPVAGLLADATRRPVRLWIDWGMVRSGGLHNSFIEERATVRGREMVELLKGFGMVEQRDVFWVEDAQGAHDEASWARRFPEVMRALYPAAP
jgi:enterochelin esterase-like enzyme